MGTFINTCLQSTKVKVLPVYLRIVPYAQSQLAEHLWEYCSWSNCALVLALWRAVVLFSIRPSVA